ncbi:L-aspartate oxidase [Haloflavibacter putidus]|uniref:L-aspartate oxidase n=1 Tax=Haloflavibacter putidus TaxID=2576776 RepID=A0A507ZHL9_9FLAO|nr:L-aspartate oxidase [Haloflavibacter putidus]TQD36970.1 L-aspartate oxidase [Haloflavibacter putidus]
MIKTNFLIIGSGAAGLTLAVKLAAKFSHKKVMVVTKASQAESNTKYAQGGIAAVFNLKKDSYQQHIQDTLKAGDGLCDKTVVEMVIKNGPLRLNELISWGANFDTNPNGKLNLGKEGGHSKYRIIHHKDATGNEIEHTLLKRIKKFKNIQVLPHHFAIDLLTNRLVNKKDRKEIACQGAYIADQISGDFFTIQADFTTLASGGIGQVYGHTTNPKVATGDGIAMAYRAKAKVKDMEFIQFHPTAFYDGKNGVSFLISEALRGYGAYLRNKNGERFMLNYDTRAELASRDIVSRAIHSEMKKLKHNNVYLDCTHLSIDDLRLKFPTIYRTCISKNIDLKKDWIPVVPAAHYLCGGIMVDINGKTSLKNLFACGECARTGLHGANRLASNSLLEALVYADRIFKYINKKAVIPHPVSVEVISNDLPIYGNLESIMQKRIELQYIMRNYAGVVRNYYDLKIAALQVEKLHKTTEKLFQEYKFNAALYEFRNMIEVARLIIEHSLNRNENKGGYFNKDNAIDSPIKTESSIE